MKLMRRVLKFVSYAFIAVGLVLVAVGSALYLVIPEEENYSAGRAAWVPIIVGTMIVFFGSQIKKWSKK